MSYSISMPYGKHMSCTVNFESNDTVAEYRRLQTRLTKELDIAIANVIATCLREDKVEGLESVRYEAVKDFGRLYVETLTEMWKKTLRGL